MINIPKELLYNRIIPITNPMYGCLDCGENGDERNLYPYDFILKYKNDFLGISKNLPKGSIVPEHIFCIVWECPKCNKIYWFHVSTTYVVMIIQHLTYCTICNKKIKYKKENKIQFCNNCIKKYKGGV